MCLEKIIFSSSQVLSGIHAMKIPPILAPSLRGECVYNTEGKKKSVYLKNRILNKDEINGKLLHFSRIQKYCLTA